MTRKSSSHPENKRPAATNRRTGSQRSVIAKSSRLFLISIFFAAVAISALFYFRNDIYLATGGQVVSEVPAELTFRQALAEEYPELPQRKLNRFRGRKIGTDIYISRTVSSYWFAQIIINGWVPYAILLGFFTGLLYSMGIRIMGVIPSWHLAGARKRFNAIAEVIIKLRRTGTEDIQQIINQVGEGRFTERLKKLQEHHEREPDRQLCREANEAYSQAEQGEVYYALLPLGFLEFILPILGFIGTVLGVSHAVGALRWGMNNLFQARELTESVMVQFLDGFDGLVLAFMTTLFGLLGLALTALFRFHLRRNSVAVIAKIDEWSEEVINLIPQENHLKMIAKGLLVCDEKGNPIRDKYKQPIPKLAELLAKTDEKGMPLRGEDGLLIPFLTEILSLAKTTSEGLIVHDEKGNPVRDEHQQPLPRWNEMLAETDERGMPRRDDQGHIVSRLAIIKEAIQKGLFEASEENGEAVPALQGVRNMIGIATEATYGIHNALMRHIFQIVGYDDRDQYTTLIVYNKDEETGETNTIEVQGRLRSERQHGESLSMMRILAEEIIEKTGSPELPTPGKEGLEPIPIGRLVLQPGEEPVQQIAAGKAAFAVVRSAEQRTAEAELIAGVYEAVMGEMRPRESDRKRLPMSVTALGFFHEDGKEAARFGTYLPFAPHTPWLEYGTQQLLPSNSLVKCAPSFLQKNVILSTKIAGMVNDERQWLLFIALERDSGSTHLFMIPTDGENREPKSVADSFEGELVAEAVLPGKAYAFAFRSQNMTETIVVRQGKEGTTIIRLHSNDNLSALAFDSKERLHYATLDSEIGTVNEKKKSLTVKFKLDRPIQFTGLAYSSTDIAYVALQESGELIIIHSDNNGNTTPEFKSAIYPRIITALTGTPDGRYIFVGCADGSVYCRNG